MNVKKGEKELAVYEAVCRLWHQGADLRGLTVQAIAAEAGIGKGTVYEYFTSREEILGKAFLYEIDRSLDRVEEKLAQAPAFGEKLNVLFAAADTLVRLEAAGMQVLASYLEGGHGLEQLYACADGAACAARVDGLLLAVLQAGEAEGVLAPFTPMRGILAAKGLLMGYVTYLREYPDAAAEAVRGEARALLEKALG